jgi:hypothetical protein
MELMYNLAVVQTGPIMIRLFALFGFIMILIFAYNLLFKGNFVLMFIFPAQLLVPFAAAAYFISMVYATYARGYYDVVFSGTGFFLSYLAAVFLQKSYERVVKGSPRPYDKGLIIICGTLTFAFAIYLLWAVMGYNFFIVVYDFFLTIFRWLGLYTPQQPGQGLPGRGGMNLMFLLLSFRKLPFTNDE